MPEQFSNGLVPVQLVTTINGAVESCHHNHSVAAYDTCYRATNNVVCVCFDSNIRFVAHAPTPFTIHSRTRADQCSQRTPHSGDDLGATGRREIPNGDFRRRSTSGSGDRYPPVTDGAQ